MSRGKPQPTRELLEEPPNPLATGFWLGFWSLLLLIIGSWFARSPLIVNKDSPKKSGRLSVFKAPRQNQPVRDLSGKPSR